MTYPIDEPESLVPITPSTEYTRAVVSALIALNGRKWGKKLVREVSKFLASEDTFVAPIKPAAGAEQAAKVHHETMILFRGHLPAYLALLDI